ncbi:MAG TPA: N-acetyl-gamma-glutamyl-phosphate reductase [Vicinamibacteria bacterium]
MSRAAVGVFGATGYAGRELVRLLRGHPRARLDFSTGSESGHLAHEAGLLREADAYFLALPHGVAATYAARLRVARPKAVVVDLSGDLRLPDAAAYKEWYGHDHPEPGLLTGVPYGLPEVFGDAIRGARLVSNPGCYATSVLLPLVPLLRAQLVAADDVVVDAKSGATGAGRTLREDLLFCEVDGDFSAYAPGRAHRHIGEMEAVLLKAAGATVRMTFCPHLLPVKRGILSALYLRTTGPAGAASGSRPKATDLVQALRTFYAGAPFVQIVEAPPHLRDVAFTNDCRISVHEAGPGRVVVFSALDNLVKGAAGQAVQNLNLALGWDETAGLPVRESA